VAIKQPFCSYRIRLCELPGFEPGWFTLGCKKWYRKSEKINFQNFSQVGNVYKAAFDVDIFSFPETLKREINRVLRYRHCLIHQGEIWENHHLIRIDLPQLQQDITVTKDFVVRINKDFEENIGTPYEILGEKWGFGSIKVKPVDEKDL